MHTDLSTSLNTAPESPASRLPGSKRLTKLPDRFVSISTSPKINNEGKKQPRNVHDRKRRKQTPSSEELDAIGGMTFVSCVDNNGLPPQITASYPTKPPPQFKEVQDRMLKRKVCKVTGCATGARTEAIYKKKGIVGLCTQFFFLSMYIIWLDTEPGHCFFLGGAIPERRKLFCLQTRTAFSLSRSRARALSLSVALYCIHGMLTCAGNFDDVL